MEALDLAVLMADNNQMSSKLDLICHLVNLVLQAQPSVTVSFSSKDIKSNNTKDVYLVYCCFWNIKDWKILQFSAAKVGIEISGEMMNRAPADVPQGPRRSEA